MINRIFFISDTVFETGEDLPECDNIYFSIKVNPSVKGDLENAYSVMEKMLVPAILTLDVHEQLSEEGMRFVTSFLFFSIYLSIEQQPVINLAGRSPQLLDKSVSRLSGYLASQGLNVNIKKVLVSEEPVTGRHRLFTSPEKFLLYYREILGSDQCFDKDVFFYASSFDVFRLVIVSLQQLETEFKENFPKVYALIDDKRLLEQQVIDLSRKLALTETELSYQKQYSDILRSDHSTRELQQYYNNEYEILPKWFKQLGHILKAITGKRTFRSLFKGKVKYKE